MGRAEYSDDLDNWAFIRWRGAVKQAIRGRRGQAFLREMLEALDALPEKKLIEDELISATGEVCAIGSVLQKRGIDVADLDPYDSEKVAAVAGIPRSLARELAYVNDEYGAKTPEQRFEIVRKWVSRAILQAERRNMATTDDRLEQIRNECRRMRGHNPAVPDIEYLLEQLNIARKDATAAHKALEESCKYIQIALNYGFGQDWTRATEPQYWLQKAQEGTA